MPGAARRSFLAVVLPGLVLAACDAGAVLTVLAPRDGGAAVLVRGKAAAAARDGLASTAALTAPIPPRGTPTTLDFGTWNLEWFGDAGNGPDDEALQLANVRDVIAGLGLDIWSVQEVTGEAHFDDLAAQLAGYEGLLADDPEVVDGAAYYSDFGDTEQKVGLLYRSDVATVLSARVILTQFDYEFAGRPPVEVVLTATVSGTPAEVVVILLHAKAGSAATDLSRRSAASAALKSYLDATHPAARVLVIGDFNDDVDQTIASSRGGASPYANFVADSADYAFPTAALSAAGASSTVFYPDMIDHHLATDELMAGYVAGSAQVFPADDYVASYAQTTSDHYPVLTRFALAAGGENAPPAAAFTWSCIDLACAFDAAGSADADGAIVAYDWDFGDGAAGAGTAPAHTFASPGTYGVTLTVTDDEGATDAATQPVTVSGPGGGEITLSVAVVTQDRGQKVAELTWSGAGSASVDVFRDGSLIATTANDGAYTDALAQAAPGPGSAATGPIVPLDRGGGGGGGTSLTYRVCEAGTSVCSNEVTVTP